jgi:hypothetical protein
MKFETTSKILAYVGKAFGLITAMNVIPFVDPKIGIIIFFVSSLIKDTVNRVADFLDDGEVNDSINKPKA